MPTSTTLRTVATAGLLMLTAAVTVAQSDTYMDADMLANAVRSIGSDEHASTTIIGTSLEKNPIHLITLSGSVDPLSQPAMLITAGIDAEHLVGTETAIRIAQQILADHSDILDAMTIYIIPLANPDGAQRNLSTLTMGTMGNARSIDDDRDRASNEDGPDDLNNDGYITQMRRLNPPINEPATHLADPDDLRLNIKAKDDQQPTFTLYTEGIDNDDDGQINEDGFGSVDLNQNFMHRWPEHATHAGLYPLSEPESMALAKFVLDHDNIVMALTLGRHDNLINLPDSKAKDLSGRAPKGIDAKDADLYKAAAELFKEATDQKTAPKQDAAGSFHAWLYAQRGIPSFATVVWTRPEIEKEDDAEESSDEKQAPEEAEPSNLHPSGIGDISQETIDELIAAYEAETGEAVDESMMAMVTPDMIEGFAAQAGVVIQRIKEPESDTESSDDKEPKKKSKSEDAKWLEYFEHAGITGLVDWQPYDHPTLGPVEIGGFIPLVKTNPPVDQLDDLAAKQTAFVVDLIETRPQITIVGPEIKQLSNGLYEIRLAITNTGKMPTATAHANKSHSIRPTVVRLSTDVEHIITGQRIARIWSIEANTGRSEHHWIIRTDNLNNETIEIIDPRFGDHTIKLGANP